MDRREAYKIDRQWSIENNENPFYTDREDEIVYIFGLASGFAYSSPVNPEEEIEEMYKRIKRS